MSPEVMQDRLAQMVLRAGQNFERRAARVQKGLDVYADCLAKDATTECPEQGERRDGGGPACPGVGGSG
eukprot:3139682-Alexandrium_andersonii.AAC.1